MASRLGSTWRITMVIRDEVEAGSANDRVRLPGTGTKIAARKVGGFSHHGFCSERSIPMLRVFSNALSSWK
jgi:hypothetical protein